MLEPEQARRALILVTAAAVTETQRLTSAGQPDRTRAVLLEAAPLVVATYSDGTSALAADHYDDLREQAALRRRFRAEPVVNLRDEKIRTGVLWATAPLFLPKPDESLSLTRLADVIQFETARPFRDTVTTNTERDPDAVGWQRITSGSGCKFCRMLAGRGAVYKAATARFASHPNCSCSAVPVFDDGAGPEASVLQYTASRRRRSDADRQRVRDFLATMPG